MFFEKEKKRKNLQRVYENIVSVTSSSNGGEMYSSCANIKNINETHYSAPLLLVSVSVSDRTIVAPRIKALPC